MDLQSVSWVAGEASAQFVCVPIEVEYALDDIAQEPSTPPYLPFNEDTTSLFATACGNADSSHLP